MSVRAHKIIEIKHKYPSTFNLWHDEELWNFLCDEEGFNNELGEEGSGMISIEVQTIKKAIKKAKELKLDKGTVKELKDDIKGLEDDDWVEYICF